MTKRFLTPFQGAILHLTLIGVPVRFGLYLTSPFGNWFGMPSPCSMYEDYDGSCPPLERFFIQDYGYRFVLFYELAIVACFVIRKYGGDASNLGLRRLNRALIVTSFINILGMAWLQHFGRLVKLDADFFAFQVLVYLLAIAISAYAGQPADIPTSKQPAKWSMPGTALFGGLSVNAIIVVTSVQALTSPDGISQLLDSSVENQVTPVIIASFAFATLQSLLCIILLKSLRDSMTLQQLRAICLYKLVLNLLFPLFWWPEMSSYVQVHQRLILTARILMTLLYLMGYLFAGKADNVGRILNSEKEE